MVVQEAKICRLPYGRGQRHEAAKAGEGALEQRQNLPSHVAIIMDGNGRWAQRRGLPRLAGHRQGAEAARRIVETAAEMGVRYLTLYTFSTENWRRPVSEVEGLLSILREVFRKYLRDMIESNVEIRIIGKVSEFPRDVQEMLAEAVEISKGKSRITVSLALNYGGRDEIVAAARSLAKDALAGHISLESITEEEFSRRVYTSGIPDPDLIIRTGGDLRVSNFLLWQLAYAELWFTDTLWPDFGAEHLAKALADFAQRKRRFGGV